MGNNSGKKQAEDSCPKNLDELFITISKKKPNILRSDLKKAWGSLIDPDLYNDIESYLFVTNHNELTSQVFKKFFTDICKGSTDQKVEVLYKLLGSKDEISGSKLLKFLTSILNSILIIQENKVPKRFDLWKSRMSQKDKTESLKEYGTYFLNHLRKSPEDEFTRSDLECLLIQFDFFLHMVICRLYDTEAKHFYTHLLPKWKYGPVDAGRTLDQLSVLDLFKILFLNLELPIDFQNEWRLLFSSSVDGESFSRLSAQIVNKGPTLIVIKDKGDHIFGGFAPASWNFGPNFFGDSRSFMFTLRPKMNVFSATNFSENYQYLNVGQQTMPNGLGMGGGILDRVWFFGLWLDSEFGTGYCSESCSTYRNFKMMSATKDFQIAHLEVWGVGPPPPTPSELGERSVLDGNLEAKAILEMAGKTAYSEGLREDGDK